MTGTMTVIGCKEKHCPKSNNRTATFTIIISQKIQLRVDIMSCSGVTAALTIELPNRHGESFSKRAVCHACSRGAALKIKQTQSRIGVFCTFCGTPCHAAFDGAAWHAYFAKLHVKPVLSELRFMILLLKQKVKLKEYRCKMPVTNILLSCTPCLSMGRCVLYRRNDSPFGAASGSKEKNPNTKT